MNLESMGPLSTRLTLTRVPRGSWRAVTVSSFSPKASSMVRFRDPQLISIRVLKSTTMMTTMDRAETMVTTDLTVTMRGTTDRAGTTTPELLASRPR